MASHEPLPPKSNYRLDIVGTRVEVAVISRPDLTLEEGTASGREMMRRLTDLFVAGTCRSQLWDMSNAPFAGPKIRAVLAEFFAQSAEHGVRTGLAANHPTQRMLYSRMLAEHMPALGAVFMSVASARAFCDGAPPSELRGWVQPLGMR